MYKTTMPNIPIVRKADGYPLSEALTEPSLWQTNQWAQQGAHEKVSNYRTLLRRHARPILIILLSCFVLSMLVTLMMPARYTSKALVEVLAVNQEFMNNKDVDPNVSASTMDSYLDTQTRLLTSTSLTDRVESNLVSNADAYQPAKQGKLSKIAESLHLIRPYRASFVSDVRYCLAHLKVKPEGQSSLISITVSGPTAQLAAEAANAVANQHIASLQEARGAMANQTTDFLTEQLTSLKVKLRQSEDALQSYARNTGLLFPGGADHESVGAAKLREVQSDLEKAESDRADKQSQMELIDSSSADALPKVLDDGSIRETNSRLADLRRQLADLSSLYTPNHYKVKEVQSQIAALEEQLKQQKTSILARVKNEYRAATRREALQKQEYDRQLSLVTNQSSQEIGYNLLKREVDANRDLYQSILQKIKEANVVSALHASNVRIVDPAKPSSSPDQPNALINGGVGLLAGCMISVLFVLLRERADRSIRIAGQTLKALQMPELAIVPAAKRDIRTQIVSVARNGGRRSLLRGGSTELPELSKELVNNWRNSNSVVAESFRSAVASVNRWGRDSQGDNKVILITSAHCSAGKTTSVLNLGLGLVESGRKVLMVDGDLRLPRLGGLFGVDGSSGLTDILGDGLHPSVATELVVETELPGLYLLPSGSRYANVTELLHSDALSGLIQQLKSEFDFILIDSPPALPLTDARLLALHADGVIVVIKAGSTTIEQTMAVQHQFVQDGGRVIGSILNNWDGHSEDPAYMNSYAKYAVSGSRQYKARVKLNIKKSSASAGN